MKRAFGILAGLCLVLVIGCSAYDSRLQQTLEELRYRKRLNDNLIEAPTKGKLQELAIYVRPPRNLKGPTQTFTMTVVEPGKFDLENSFIDQDKQESMHLLARVVRPKAPNAKKGAAQPEPTPRGKFFERRLRADQNRLRRRSGTGPAQARDKKAWCSDQHLQRRDNQPHGQESSSLLLW